eukprot:2852389-Prymnesium_polylepis.1
MRGLLGSRRVTFHVRGDPATGYSPGTVRYYASQSGLPLLIKRSSGTFRHYSHPPAATRGSNETIALPHSGSTTQRFFPANSLSTSDVGPRPLSKESSKESQPQQLTI